MFILLHKKFLQFDWLRAVVFQFYFEINVYMFSVIFQNCPKIVTYNNFEFHSRYLCHIHLQIMLLPILICPNSICMSILWALVFLHVYELLLVAARKHLNGSNIDIVERFRGYLILSIPPKKSLPTNFSKSFLCVCEILRSRLYNETVFI